jgi:hypothetical protein
VLGLSRGLAGQSVLNATRPSAKPRDCGNEAMVERQRRFEERWST